MHDRKVEMARRAEVFFGLPGGFGTFEEVMEVSTWTQLGIHRKRKFAVPSPSFQFFSFSRPSLTPIQPSSSSTSSATTTRCGR